MDDSHLAPNRRNRVYDQLDFKKPRSSPKNLQVSKTPIPTFICPSDTHNGLLDQRGLTHKTINGAVDPGDNTRAVNNYKSCWGITWPLLFGRWHCGTSDADNRTMKGIMNGIWSFDRPIRMRDITDGLSHSIAVGEDIPAACFYTWWTCLMERLPRPARP